MCWEREFSVFLPWTFNLFEWQTACYLNICWSWICHWKGSSRWTHTCLALVSSRKTYFSCWRRWSSVYDCNLYCSKMISLFCTALKNVYVRGAWYSFLHLVVSIVPVGALLPSDWEAVGHSHFIELAAMVVSGGSWGDDIVFGEIGSFPKSYSAFPAGQGRMGGRIMVVGLFASG